MSYLPAALDWSMGAFGGRIEWSDCASLLPSQWAYEDLEIFYMSGHCHHLALAIHRRFGFQIGVLMETDPDELSESGLPLPHHVFAFSPTRQEAIDIRGRRPIAEVIDDLAVTVGLCKPVVQSFRTEAEFRREVLDRGDSCLKPVDEIDIERASGLVMSRMQTFGDEYQRVAAAFSMTRSASDAGRVL